MAKTTSRIATYEMQHAFDFFVQDCGECGVIFAVPTSFNQRRRSDGQTFYGPNGHRRVYQETDVQRERKARERAEDGPPSGAGDGGGTDATASTPPAETASLPADWRDLIGHATYLLRLDAAQVAAAATADDDADLCALTEWCFRYVQAKEQNA